MRLAIPSTRRRRGPCGGGNRKGPVGPFWEPFFLECRSRPSGSLHSFDPPTAKKTLLPAFCRAWLLRYIVAHAWNFWSYGGEQPGLAGAWLQMIISPALAPP